MDAGSESVRGVDEEMLRRPPARGGWDPVLRSITLAKGTSLQDLVYTLLQQQEGLRSGSGA